jgi:hypothetical protein
MNIAVTLDQCFDQCFLSIKPNGGLIRTLNLRISNQVFYFCATSSGRVTRLLEKKDLPNFSKNSPSQKGHNIYNKVQFENTKHLHQTTFKTLKYLQQTMF